MNDHQEDKSKKNNLDTDFSIEAIKYRFAKIWNGGVFGKIFLIFAFMFFIICGPYILYNDIFKKKNDTDKSLAAEIAKLPPAEQMIAKADCGTIEIKDCNALKGEWIGLMGTALDNASERVSIFNEYKYLGKIGVNGEEIIFRDYKNFCIKQNWNIEKCKKILNEFFGLFKAIREKKLQSEQDAEDKGKKIQEDEEAQKRVALGYDIPNKITQQVPHNIQNQGNMINGIKEGKWIEYGENGIREEGNYINGEKDGHWFIYKSSHGKQPWADTEYKNNLENGKSISYNADGSKSGEFEYLNGKMDGTWTIYFENGKPQEVFHYKNGIQEGEYIKWNMDGNVEMKANFENGKMISAESSPSS